MRQLGVSWQQERRLRRQCEARLDALDVRAPYDLGVLVQRVSATRGRPLHLLPLAAEASAVGDCSGMWVATDSEDWVFVAQDAAGDYRDLIIAHELSHMVCGHPADAEISDIDLRRLTPTLNPDHVRSALRRTTYDTRTEREAEMMGSLILARIASSGSVPRAGATEPTSDAGEVLARLSRVLR